MAKIVVLDPNIWISLAWKNDFTLLVEGLEQGFIFASSQKATQEINEVLRRSKFAKKIPPLVIRETLSLHQELCVFVKPLYIFTDSPDPKDNYLFDICREARAKYLITGDRSLLAIEEVRFANNHITKIISLSRFREFLR